MEYYMGMQNDKKIERILNIPVDYSAQEMFTLLRGLGHVLNRRKGSAVTFTNGSGGQPVSFHVPHRPKKYFGQDTVKRVVRQLQGYKLIEKD